MIQNDAIAGKQSARITVTTAKGSTQFFQKNLKLEPNSTYFLSFSAYSSLGSNLTASLGKQSALSVSYGLTNFEADLTKSWNKFTTQFTTSGFTTAVLDAQLTFDLTPFAKSGSTYTLDNIELFKLQDGGGVLGPAPKTVKVFQIIFNPIIESAGSLRLIDLTTPYKRKWNNPSDLDNIYISDVLEVSRNLMKYQIVESQTLDEWPLLVNGYQYTDASYLDCLQNDKFCHGTLEADALNYISLLNRFDICGKIQRKEIDEVWLWGGPYFGFSESTMAGNDGFFINGYVPGLTCVDRLVIMGYNYERDETLMLHNLGHRIEDTMGYYYGQEYVDGHGDRNRPDTIWDKFTMRSGLSGYSSISPGCGVIHFPPNNTWVGPLDPAAGGYETNSFSSTLQVESSCDDFLNYPNLTGNTTPVSCVNWLGPNCRNIEIDRKYYKWWMLHIPHGVGFTSGISNNWWGLIAVVPGIGLTQKVTMPEVSSLDQYYSIAHCINTSTQFSQMKATLYDGIYGSLAISNLEQEITLPSFGAKEYKLLNKSVSLQSGKYGLSLASNQKFSCVETTDGDPQLGGFISRGSSTGISKDEAGNNAYIPHLVKDVDGLTSSIAYSTFGETVPNLQLQIFNPAGALVYNAAKPNIYTITNLGDIPQIPHGFRGSAILKTNGNEKVSATSSITGTRLDSPTSKFNQYNAQMHPTNHLYLPRILKNYYGFDSEIAIQNVGETSTTVIIIIYSGSSTTPYIIAPPIIPAKGSVTINTANIAAFSSWDTRPVNERQGFAEITAESSGQIAATVTEFNLGNCGFASCPPIPANQISWSASFTAVPIQDKNYSVFFPEIFRNAGASTYLSSIRIQNTDRVATATCKADYYGYTGTRVGSTANIPMAFLGLEISATEMPGFTDGMVGSALVTCSAPIVGIATTKGNAQTWGDALTIYNGIQM